MSVICVEAIIYLLLHNMDDCIFKIYVIKRVWYYGPPYFAIRNPTIHDQMMHDWCIN